MRFYDFHPLTLIVYFASVIAFTMITMNPFLLLLSFFGAFLSVKIITKKSSFTSYIIIFAAICLTNPIFSHNGETVLFYIFDQRVTLEALIYGVGAGLLILSVLYWFNLFSYVFTEDKLVWLVGKISPKLCVVFCMALRFIPLFKENAANIYNAQLSMGIFETNTFKGKLKLITNVFSALISISVENAIETADTMSSRGFGGKKRSSYSLVCMSKRDVLFIFVSLLLDLLVIINLLSGEGVFYYYPALYFEGFSILYVVFAVLCHLPVLNELTEEIKWKYLISKI